MSSSASSSSASVSSDRETSPGSSSERSPSPDSEALLGKRKRTGITTQSGDENEENDDDVPVLSHAEKRRQKKKQKTEVTGKTKKSKAARSAEPDSSRGDKSDAVPKRQNSVWVGNLSFKTTEDQLKTFFDGVGEITRIHMPMKAPTPGQRGPGVRKENRGFAYVDFATPGGKQVAVAMSEQNLDGRRLLIKDGDDYTGRPTPALNNADTPGQSETHSKFAQKILASQKQPAAPTLFFGNLGFEATEDSIRGMLKAHRSKESHTSKKVKETDEDDSGAQTKGKGKPGADDGEDEAAVDADEEWIRKIRLGTFEDSGKCKGWAFVDFVSVDAATAALLNPRNHKLDGRQLKLEYASADAVRRGGGSNLMPGVHTDGGKAKAEGQKGRHKREKPFQTARARKVAEGAEAARESRRKRPRLDAAEGEGEGESEQQGRGSIGARKESRPRVADRKERYTGTKSRAKPGAALAQAQRQSVAIQPSQGSKITF